MKNFNFKHIAFLAKHCGAIGMIAAMSIIQSCSKNDGNDLPPGSEKSSQNDTIRLNIANVAELDPMLARTSDSTKFYQIRVIRNLSVNAANLDRLRVFGAWKNKQSDNVSVDWSKTGATKSSDASHAVVPDGRVPLTYEKYAKDYGAVPLAENDNPQSDDAFVVPAGDVQKFEESGANDAVSSYNGEEIVINDPDQLPAWTSVILNYAGGKNARGADDANKAKVRLDQALTGGSKGLLVKTQHMSHADTIARYAVIINNNLQPDEIDVSTKYITLSSYNIIYEGKFNNGKMFYVSGADGADLMANSGVYIRTDTAGFGADGEKLNRAVPDRLIINQNGGNAAGLRTLADYRNGTIEIEPQSDNTLPGEQKALRGYDDSTLDLFSIENYAEKSGYPYNFKSPPVLTIYANNPAELSAEEAAGAIDIKNYANWTGNYSGQKIRASHEQVARFNKTGETLRPIVKSDTTRYWSYLNYVRFETLCDHGASLMTHCLPDGRAPTALIDNGLFVFMSDAQYDGMTAQEKLRYMRQWFAISQINFAKLSQLPDPGNVH
ncbi:MAG: hypothetical protein LBD50_02415 [Rickettsiales bacterium]|jgi:hypothetical protein|nr:hypothetical protein [Rickettsiales bacterium]